MGSYSFGNYICRLREKKGLSQGQLGEKLGVTNKAVSRWENGGAYPSTELMLPLAEALGVTIEDLYKAVSESKAPKTKLRVFLEWMMHRSTVITIICAVLAAVPYILFTVFSNAEEKNLLLTLAPIMSAIIFIMFYFVFVLFKRNPFASARTLDICTVIFLIVMAFGYFSTLRYLIIDFPNGFSPSLCFSPIGFMAVVKTLKRRY